MRRLMSAAHEPIYKCRIEELVRRIGPHLQNGDRVLDVGCGGGMLGAAIMQQNPGVEVTGLERFKRGEEKIAVHEYNGIKIPFTDCSFDVVIIADVLHHEHDPDRLIAECARVSQRLLIIKDHKVMGPVSWMRVALIDWAANAPYGVQCLFRYNSLSDWHRAYQRHQLTLVEEADSLNIYPLFINFLFGRRLQYFSVVSPKN
jgi:ubiquinone/menaquinone biosynthesis C-methylase UbiE